MRLFLDNALIRSRKLLITVLQRGEINFYCTAAVCKHIKPCRMIAQLHVNMQKQTVSEAINGGIG